MMPERYSLPPYPFQAVHRSDTSQGQRRPHLSLCVRSRHAIVVRRGNIFDFLLEGPNESPEISIEEDCGSEEDRELRLFSRGVLAQSLLRLGISIEEALRRVANDIQGELGKRG